MNTNLSTHFSAIQTERSRLSSQAERGWQADQAPNSGDRHSAAHVVGRSVGILLVSVGERLQGAPRRTISDTVSRVRTSG